MKTRNVTKIELDFDEKEVLEEAIEILKDINRVIYSDTDIDYTVGTIDMDLYNSLFNETNNIKDWITIE